MIPTRLHPRALRIAFYTDNGILFSDTGNGCGGKEGRGHVVRCWCDMSRKPVPTASNRRTTSGGIYPRRMVEQGWKPCSRPRHDRGGSLHETLSRSPASGRPMSPADFGALISKWDSVLRHHDPLHSKLRRHYLPCSRFSRTTPRLHTRKRYGPRIQLLFYLQPYGLAGCSCSRRNIPEGLPIGVQVVAHPWREDVALGVAQHIETVSGGWHPPPL